MDRINSCIRRIVFMLLVLSASLMCFSFRAAAEGTWQKDTASGSYTYTFATENGDVKAIGLQKIDAYYYYFDNEGILQTGWVKTADGYRYFKTKGTLPKYGSMFTGLRSIAKQHYFFDANGVLQTGFYTLPRGSYFFTKTGEPGVIGRAVTKKWKTVKGKKYFFGKDGRMVTNAWVGKYYVGADGARLINTITPDGYQVGEKGKKVSTRKVSGLITIEDKTYFYNLRKNKLVRKAFKTVEGDKYYFGTDYVAVTGLQTIKSKKYYFNEDGVMQSGRIVIDGTEYYFSSAGPLLISGKENGYTTDENGVIIKKSKSAEASESMKPKVLIVAGHGQGDSGAVSPLGMEYLKTREFASLIYNNLKDSDAVDAVYYKNGSTSYDLYQQHVRTLGSGGLNIASKITGRGTVKKQVIKGSKTNANLPVLTDYDYVLEVHFNATAVSNKDHGGNGVYKGFSFYVNSLKKSYKVENAMISGVRKLGFAVFGGGVHGSSTLFNARICQELGVDYSLVETAFIDDADDMRFYNSHKKEMAKVAADAIIKYYGAA